jgi:hypothetical protein
MKRRELILFLGGAALGAKAITANAQQRSMPVIGYLHFATLDYRPAAASFLSTGSLLDRS